MADITTSEASHQEHKMDVNGHSNGNGNDVIENNKNDKQENGNGDIEMQDNIDVEADNYEKNKKLARVKWNSSTVESVRVDFHNLTLKLSKPKTRKAPAVNKLILNNVSGTIHPNRLAFILGPSGSGKTSLLTVLAARTKQALGLSLHGTIRCNGLPVDWKSYRHNIAYVEQDDLLFPNLTVRETLMIAVELRMNQSMTIEDKATFVTDIMADLGLSAVADSKIGDSTFKAISGGERKRVAVAIEILSSPPLIFCDEPTSGLDANASLSVVQLLHRLAVTGRSVVISIHQPRSSIFALAHDLFLLAKGELAYFGPAQEFIHFLASIGQPCPNHFNPADFAIDIVSMDYRSAELEKQTSDRISLLTKSYSSSIIGKQSLKNTVQYISSKNFSGPIDAKSSQYVFKSYKKSGTRASFCKQFGILFVRAIKNKFRSKQFLIGPVIVASIFGLVLGALYFDIGFSQKAIQDRKGILFFLCLNQSFNALISALSTFGGERTIILRERSAKSYRVSAYYLSRVIVDIPFSVMAPWVCVIIAYWMAQLNPSPARFFTFLALITLTHFTAFSLGLVVAANYSPQGANLIGSQLFLILMLFGGFYANIELISPVIAWIQYISPIRWVFAAAVINEFTGETFECSGPATSTPCISNGEQVIASLSFEYDSVWRSCVVLISFIIFYQFLAYLSLRRNKPVYIKPVDENNGNSSGKNNDKLEDDGPKEGLIHVKSEDPASIKKEVTVV